MSDKMQPIDTAPKDGTTIIATGGWYISPLDGQRLFNVPSLISWQDGKWKMMDDHGAEYNEPTLWMAIP